ncbi:MAG: ATP-binding protein [Rectinemataceae bacterium]
MAAKKGLGFTLSLPELPGSVDLGAGRLRQVLANLLDNAVKFTATGQVDFDLRFVRDPDARGKLVFSVSDTGIGIPQDRMDRLLEPFSQIDGSKTRKFGGLGLGLFMSRLLVQKMGGSITITSESGRGSKFEFEIGTVFHDGDYEDLAGLGPFPASAGEEPKSGTGTKARKASIPADVVAKTREASRDGDAGQLEAIADELGKSDPEAAGTLRQLLETYDYAGIETWLSGMEGTDGHYDKH